MKILEIRAKLEKQEGFDLAKFHDKLLGLGSVPLEILEEEMLSEEKVWLFFQLEYFVQCQYNYHVILSVKWPFW